MEEAADVEEGLPAWVMTFADLMTLLMCFYVLMLSFSEMDVAKFKQLSGSVKQAFGVQTGALEILCQSMTLKERGLTNEQDIRF